MLRKLQVTDASILDLAADFDCGSEPYQKEVSDWIKPGEMAMGAAEQLVAGECEIWIYLNENGELVGFGSLGPSDWRYPTKKSEKRPVNIIPNVAIQTRFQSQGFFKQILAHLFAEAAKHTEREPAIGLYVHPENVDAIEKYRRYGFDFFHHRYRDKSTGVEYRSMIVKLPS